MRRHEHTPCALPRSLLTFVILLFFSPTTKGFVLFEQQNSAQVTASSQITPSSIVQQQRQPLISMTRSNSYYNSYYNTDTKHVMNYYTQVVSDVDDTLKSSGGVNVAGVALGGIDVQYERGDFYPGVAEFMLELSRPQPPGGSRTAGSDKSTNAAPDGAADSIFVPKVAILTARAEEFKVALELKDTSKLAVAFRTAGEAVGIPQWGLGPVLYGSVAEWIVQVNKGLRKFNNFERVLLQQDPTGTLLQYIYVGDTGELDQEAGETMLREYPQFVKAVFLHVVSGDDPASAAAAPIAVPPPKFINGRPLLFFRTYVGAAAKAAQLRLMTPGGLQRVMDAAQHKLKDVPRDSDKWTDLERDLQEAHRTLKK